MKKYQILFCLIFSILLFSCKREKINVSAMDRETLLLKKRFGFSNLLKNQDFRNNKKLIDGIKKTNTVTRYYAGLENLVDLSNVTEYQFDDGTVILSIPFFEDVKEVLIVTFKEDPNTTIAYNIEKTLVLTNHVDTNGNGTMELVFNDEIIKKSYQLGNEISDTTIYETSPQITNEEDKLAGGSICQRLPNETFRQCFDRMYNTICDGFWGCLAWYTNVGVPVLSAAVCDCKK